MVNLTQMKKFISSTIFLYFIFTASLGAADVPPANKPLQTITLKGGTVLKGHLVKIENDSYAIETEHMGQVQVNVANIANITNGGTPPVTSQTPSLPTTMTGNPTGNSMNVPSPQGNVGAIQQQLMADPDIQTSVQDLVKDPEIQKLLTSGNLLQDAMSMDPAKIQNNPNIKDLMQSPKMQQLMQKINQKYGGQGMTAPQVNP